MDRRRGCRGGFYNDQRGQGSTPYSRKPPLRIWKPTVPQWEKQFCYSVGCVPWKKLLEVKKYMSIYDNVVKWNDSACEEAFHDAKNRYWARINGFPCDTALPDPNIYIDKVDWESEVDPELISDLEREPEEISYYESGVIVNMEILYNEWYGCVGWGDEKDFPEAPVFVPAAEYRGGTEQDAAVGNNYKTSWEQNWALYNATGKGDSWGGDGGWRRWNM